MKDKQYTCGKPADVQFAWGGEIVRMCEEHARGVAAVGNTIGMPVRLEKINPISKCESHDKLD